MRESDAGAGKEEGLCENRQGGGAAQWEKED